MGAAAAEASTMTPSQHNLHSEILPSLGSYLAPFQTTTGVFMSVVESLQTKAEAYLEKARRMSDRQRARLLLVQAHNYLKRAEETEAEQLSGR
jgi:hypothetical protein